MYIYRIYNIETNESYIGQTVKSVDYRLKEHIREAKRALRGETRSFSFFHRLLLYYGEDKFKAEFLEEVPDSEGDIREAYWIEYYNSYYEGYNSTRGGQNRPMAELRKESDEKWKMRDTSEQKKEIDKSPQGGMSIQEVIAKGLYNPKGNINAGKPVAQYSKDGMLLNIFPAASIASKETNTSVAGIRNVCNGVLKTSGGYIWSWVEKEKK